MKNKKIVVRVVLITAIILIISSVILFFVLKQPAEQMQYPEIASPVRVRILNPTTGSGWPLNYDIPIQVSAWGKNPISKAILFINGIPYKENFNNGIESEAREFLTQFNWQPGGIGEYIFTIQAYDDMGESGISNPVLVNTGEAAITRTQIDVNSGSTLEQIAIDYDVSIEEIQLVNPDIDPKVELTVGDIAFIPNPPLPLSEVSIIPPLDPNDNGEQNSATPPEEPAQAANFDLPYAPTIHMKYEGCDVKLRIENIGYFNDSSDPNLGELTREDGFYVYRSRDGGEFERVVTFPPRITFTDPEEFYTYESDWSYIDTEQFGLLTYYISAFNENGESSGTPVVVPLHKTNCADPSRKGAITVLWLEENGDLNSIINLDVAYLYIQMNDDQAVRVPEGDRFFLPSSGIAFNIYDYLDMVSNGIMQTDIKIHMEVWGWLAAELVHVGDIDHVVNRSVLSICSEEGQGSCSGGGSGQWVQEMQILPNSVKPLNEQKYDIHWQITELTKTSKMCLTITPRNYTGPGLLDTSNLLLYNCDAKAQTDGGSSKGNEGIVTLDFGKLLYPDTEYRATIPGYTGDWTENYQDRDFQDKYPLGTPFTLSMRFRPSYLDDHQFDDVSNTALMHYQTQNAPPDLPPLQSDVPSLYDVQILEDTYREPKYEVWSKWGCIIVDNDPTGKYSAGTKICPITYVDCDINVNCSGFWDYVGSAWDFLANQINGAKGTISDAISDNILGCSENSLCEDVVNKGIDYGVAVMTGIPPDLPNFDALVSQGIAESIILGLSGLSDEDVEYVCGSTCKDAIASQIEPFLRQAKSYNSQPACFDMGGHYNMFPPCLDPSIQVHPAEGSVDVPGFVMVRVTRKDTPESIAADKGFIDKTRLHLIVNAENPSRAGYYYNKCKYVDNVPLENLPDPSNPSGLANRGYGDLGDGVMNGQLYSAVDITIPWLEPGQAIDLPVMLKPITVPIDYGCIETSRNQYLFFKGASHMLAQEYCYSSGSSWDWVPCTDGGQDSWDYVNPIAPLGD